MEEFIGKPIPEALNNRFKTIRILGQGGLSSVFLVQDRKYNCEYRALKLLNPNKLDAQNLNRFKKEFAELKRIDHPNMIKAFELIETERSVGYLMEAVFGSNLLELISSRKPDFSEIDDIFSCVLSALFELHNHKLAHRDIKLENILIGEDGIVKLSDLGLMKKDGDEESETGILLGTSQYLPPEYVKHSVYNFRSDIYATGLMLFECLVGRRWLEGKNGKTAIEYLCGINFEFPKLAMAGLPNKYQKILETALMVQPWKRFASAEAMRQALLSESGILGSTQTVALSENISLSAVQQKRKTSEFLSQKARRRRIVMGIASSLGAAAITMLAGVATGISDREPTYQVPLSSSIETATEAGNSDSNIINSIETLDVQVR